MSLKNLSVKIKIPKVLKNKLKNKITNSKKENEIIIDLQTVKTKNIKET